MKNVSLQKIFFTKHLSSNVSQVYGLFLKVVQNKFPVHKRFSFGTPIQTKILSNICLRKINWGKFFKRSC